MFIRKKKINGSYYAYLVTNRWTSKGSRQKAKYLGRILQLPIKKEISIEEYFRQQNKGNSIEEYIKNITKRDIIMLLYRYELEKRGFLIQNSETKTQYLELNEHEKKYIVEPFKIHEKITQTTQKKRRIKENSELVIESNQGFMCSFSIQRLINRIPKGYDDRAKGIIFTKSLLEAGFHVEGEFLLQMYIKWCQDNK